MTPAPLGPFLLVALRCAAAFALALLAISAAIAARLPSLRVSPISQKLDQLEAHRGEIDTVFIGSSRVFGAFIPEVFDRENAARGTRTRSFNFGINGMRPPESFYVLREVLKRHLPLRWVLIELVDIFPKVNAANLSSARNVHWHDLRHTALVLRQIARSPAPMRDRAEQALVHAASFLARLSNLGRGPEWVETVLRGPARSTAAGQEWERRAGFEPAEAPVIAGQRRADYERMVAYFGAHGLPEAALSPLLAGALRDVLAEVRAAGAQPIFVISPTVLPHENLADLTAAGLDAPLIAFTSPRRHPAIFRAENHCDEQHLNPAGAAEYSRALAEEFVGATGRSAALLHPDR